MNTFQREFQRVVASATWDPSQEEGTALLGSPFPPQLPGSLLPVHMSKSFLGNLLLDRCTEEAEQEGAPRPSRTRTQRVSDGVYSEGEESDSFLLPRLFLKKVI